MSWFKEIVEGVFHWSNITYISNAYKNDCWMSITTNKLEFDEAKWNASASLKEPNADVSVMLKRFTNASWEKLPSGESIKITRNAKTEYITIVAGKSLDKSIAAAGGHSGKVLLLDKEIQQNLSFILTREGSFQQQKYGVDNLWEDWRGVNHNPN